MAQLLYPPSTNALQKQLNADYTTADAVITLTNTTGVQNKPGLIVINRIDTNSALQPAADWTYIEFTGTSGATLTGCTAIAGDQDHGIGEVVEFVSDVTAQQRILDALANLVVVGTGALDTTKVVDLTTAQTLTNKTLTAPTITSPVLTLDTSVPVTNGRFGHDDTNNNLIIGDGTVAQKIHYGAWIDWTPTITGFTSTPTYAARYTIIGKAVYLIFSNTAATSNATTFTITAPFAGANNGIGAIGYGQGTDAGAYAPNVLATMPGNAITITLATGGGATGWTASGNKAAKFSLFYEAA